MKLVLPLSRVVGSIRLVHTRRVVLCWPQFNVAANGDASVGAPIGCTCGRWGVFRRYCYAARRLCNARMYRAALTACTLGLLTSCSSAAHDPTRTTVRQEPQKSRGLVAFFAVLGAPRTAHDELPPSGRALLAEQPNLIAPQNYTHARSVSTQWSTWLIPAKGEQLCLIRELYPLRILQAVGLPPIAAADCATVEEARHGQLVITQSAGATVHGMADVLGVVPDGVRSVMITSRNHRRTSTLVARNAYAAAVATPMQVSFLTHDDHGHLRRYVIPIVTPTTTSPRATG